METPKLNLTLCKLPPKTSQAGKPASYPLQQHFNAPLALAIIPYVLRKESLTLHLGVRENINYFKTGFVGSLPLYEGQ